MTALQPDYFDRPLAEVDPEVAEAIGHEVERQQRTLEMIASENFVPQAVLECQGSVLTNKYAEGYPGQALLRRLRVHRRDRAARDRPREGAVRRRARERPAARGRAGQHGRLPRAAAAGRPDHGPQPPARRPSQPRHEDQRLRPALRHRPVRGLARGPPDRHGRGRAPGQGAPPEAAAGGLVGLLARPRLPALPRDRRRGRRAADGRHGALRRPRRGGHPPEPGPVRRRRHHARSTRRSAARAPA